MLVAKLSCQRLQSGDEEKQWDIFAQLLASLTRGGNIVYSDWITCKSDSEFAIFTCLPAEDALQEENLSKYAKDAFAKLSTIGLGPLDCTIQGHHAEERAACECKQNSWLILFTNFLTLQPSVRCGDCFAGVPFYRLSKSEGSESYNIRGWEGVYQACDNLQMQCGVGERFGYQQMSNYNSKLSKKGRDICARVEKLTNLPTYYYLHRYYGRSVTKEKARKCPDCGGDWFLAEPLHRIFDFKCDSSRLLSTIAVDLR